MANDHQVPQFYLRNFKITKLSKIIQNNHVYTYTRNKTPVPEAIVRVACEDDYYNINEGNHEVHSEGNNFILSTLENHASSIVRRIVDKTDLNLSRSEKWTLAYFVATLCIRNPLFHEFLEKQILDEKKREIMSIASEKDFALLVKEFDPSISDEEIEEMKQIGLNADEKLKISLSENDHNKSYLRTLLPVAHYVMLTRRLFSYHWHLLVIPSEKTFVTSDNPVVFLPPMCRDVVSFGHSPVFLPINPKFALLIHPIDFVDKKILVEDDLVDYYIKQSILFSKDKVFSHQKSEKLQEILDNTKHNMSDLNYQFNFLPEKTLKLMIISGVLNVNGNYPVGKRDINP